MNPVEAKRLDLVGKTILAILKAPVRTPEVTVKALEVYRAVALGESPEEPYIVIDPDDDPAPKT